MSTVEYTHDPAPCRYCAEPAYAHDAEGPLHPCCQYWADEIATGRPCPACAASRGAGRRGRR